MRAVLVVLGRTWPTPLAGLDRGQTCGPGRRSRPGLPRPHRSDDAEEPPSGQRRCWLTAGR